MEQNKNTLLWIVIVIVVLLVASSLCQSCIHHKEGMTNGESVIHPFPQMETNPIYAAPGDIVIYPITNPSMETNPTPTYSGPGQVIHPIPIEGNGSEEVVILPTPEQGMSVGFTINGHNSSFIAPKNSVITVKPSIDSLMVLLTNMTTGKVTNNISLGKANSVHTTLNSNDTEFTFYSPYTPVTINTQLANIEMSIKN